MENYIIYYLGILFYKNDFKKEKKIRRRKICVINSFKTKRK